MSWFVVIIIIIILPSAPINERYDEYTFDIEPLEKEWMLAVVDNNMDEIHRILLTDSTFINKKGFLHGWVRMDVVTKDGCGY